MPQTENSFFENPTEMYWRWCERSTIFDEQNCERQEEQNFWHPKGFLPFLRFLCLSGRSVGVPYLGANQCSNAGVSRYCCCGDITRFIHPNASSAPFSTSPPLFISSAFVQQEYFPPSSRCYEVHHPLVRLMHPLHPVHHQRCWCRLRKCLKPKKSAVHNKNAFVRASKKLEGRRAKDKFWQPNPVCRLNVAWKLTWIFTSTTYFIVLFLFLDWFIDNSCKQGIPRHCTLLSMPNERKVHIQEARRGRENVCTCVGYGHWILVKFQEGRKRGANVCRLWRSGVTASLGLGAPQGRPG